MPKIKEIVEIKKKEWDKNIDLNDQEIFPVNQGYNQALSDLGNKSIGLDVDKIRKVIHELPLIMDNLMPSQVVFLAIALKQAEGEIICEVKD